MKINGENNSEISIFIFTVFINSAKSCPKGLKCSILVRNFGEAINVPRSNR